jgi:urea transporter
MFLRNLLVAWVLFFIGGLLLSAEASRKDADIFAIFGALMSLKTMWTM